MTYNHPNISTQVPLSSNAGTELNNRFISVNCMKSNCFPLNRHAPQHSSDCNCTKWNFKHLLNNEITCSRSNPEACAPVRGQSAALPWRRAVPPFLKHKRRHLLCQKCSKITPCGTTGRLPVTGKSRLPKVEHPKFEGHVMLNNDEYIVF